MNYEKKLLPFQKKTITEMEETFKRINIIILKGIPKSGKSEIAKAFVKKFQHEDRYEFIGSFTDQKKFLGVTPKKIEKNVKKKGDLGKTIELIQDFILTTTGFISTNPFFPKEQNIKSANTVEELLKIEKGIVLFDSIEYFDSGTESLMIDFMLKLSKEVISPKIKCIVCLGTEDEKYKFLQKYDEHSGIKIVEIADMSQEDLDHEHFPRIKSFWWKQDLILVSSKDVEHHYSELEKLLDERLVLYGPDLLRIIYTVLFIENNCNLKQLLSYNDDMKLYSVIVILDTLEKEKILIEHNQIYSINPTLVGYFSNNINNIVKQQHYNLILQSMRNYGATDYHLYFKFAKELEQYNEATKHAFSSMAEMMRGESAINSGRINEIIEYLKNTLLSEEAIAFYDTLSCYNLQEYDQATEIISKLVSYNGRDKLLKKYPLEIYAEFFYLFQLCSARNSSEKNVQQKEKILAAVINISRDIEKNVGKGELYFRYETLHMVYLMEYSKKTKKANDKFEELRREYYSKIADAPVFLQDFWKQRLGTHLMKIGMFDGVYQLESVLQEGYQTLKNVQETFPTHYYRGLNNYGGLLLYLDREKESFFILDRAVKDLKELKMIKSWGIVYQMYCLSALLIRKEDFSSIFNMYMSFLEEQQPPMHEQIKTTVNHAIMYAYLKKYKKAEKLLIGVYNKDNSELDNYLISTNLVALKCLTGKFAEASEFLSSSKEFTEKKDPLFYQPFLLIRQRELENIIAEKKQFDNILDLITDSEQTTTSGFSNTRYFSLGFICNIEYWVNY